MILCGGVACHGESNTSFAIGRRKTSPRGEGGGRDKAVVVTIRPDFDDLARGQCAEKDQSRSRFPTKEEGEIWVGRRAKRALGGRMPRISLESSGQDDSCKEHARPRRASRTGSQARVFTVPT